MDALATRCDEAGRDRSTLGTTAYVTLIINEDIKPDQLPKGLGYAVVGGPASIADQIQAKVLDVGVDGVIISLAAHGYTPRCHHHSGRSAASPAELMPELAEACRDHPWWGPWDCARGPTALHVRRISRTSKWIMGGFADFRKHSRECQLLIADPATRSIRATRVIPYFGRSGRVSCVPALAAKAPAVHSSPGLREPLRALLRRC
jgi:hypothetical protein